MSLQSNIWKIFANRIIRNFIIVMPIYVLFIQSKGLNLTDLFLLQSIFSLVYVLLEIPSGYFSDRLGRKKTILIASIFFVTGAGFYAFGESFWMFAIAEALAGVGAAFFSGTDSALLFESLEELKRKKEFTRLEGKSELFNRVSEAIAAVLGGLLGAISLQYPFWVWFGISFALIPLSLSLTEPKREHLRPAKNPLQGVLQIVRFSVHEHKTVKWLLIFSACIGFATLSAVWLSQPYYQLAGLPIAFFGIAWALSNLSSGFFSFLAEHTHTRLGKKKFFWILPALLAGSFLILGLFTALPIILITFIPQAVRGLKGPIVDNYLNLELTSEKRATVLSVQGLLARLLFVILSPILGLIGDTYGLQTAFLSLAIFSLGSGILTLERLHHHQIIA